MSTSVHLDADVDAAMAATLAEVRAIAAATMATVTPIRSTAAADPAPSATAPSAPAPPQEAWDVQVLRWPAEAGQRDEVRPCLWLLAIGELPPVTGPAEDWLRLPADQRDIEARAQRLAGRSWALEAADDAVHIESDGRVERSGVVVHLPPIEAAVLDVLVARIDQVVTRDDLCRAVWGSATPSSRALDSRMHALRVRIEPLGLVVHTIRGRGFLLSAAASATAPTRWR